MKICMFVRNPVSQDPRVQREALALVQAGHQVTVIGQAAPGHRAHEVWQGVAIQRLPRLGGRLRARAQDLGQRLGRRVPPRPPENAPETAPPGLAREATPSAGLRERVRVEAAEAGYLLQAVAAGLACRAAAYHAHDLDTLEVARLCARLGRARLVYDSHELWVEWKETKGRLPAWRIARWRTQEVRGTAAADLVITVSDGIADELVRLYGIPRPLVVRNCPPLTPHEPGDGLRRRLGGDPRRPIVLYQGGFHTGRGLLELVAAAEELPDVDFVLVGGDSPFRQEVAARAQGRANVFLLPHLPLAELPALTASASLGVVLTQPVCRSYALSLGNKVFEYLMAGLPVVASDIASHAALAAETGVLAVCDPTSPAAIAAAIRSLLQDERRRQQLGAEARRWAETKYNAAPEMARLVAGYAALADRG